MEIIKEALQKNRRLKVLTRNIIETQKIPDIKDIHGNIGTHKMKILHIKVVQVERNR